MSEELSMSLACAEGKNENLMWVLTKACQNNHSVVYNDNSECFQVYEADLTWCSNGCDCCEPDVFPCFSVILAAETEEDLAAAYRAWMEENL